MSQGNPRRESEARGAEAREEISISEAPNETWVQTLEYIVEEFLQYHVDRYRGLKSLGSGRILAVS
jgi:hypothetical protein